MKICASVLFTHNSKNLNTLEQLSNLFNSYLNQCETDEEQMLLLKEYKKASKSFSRNTEPKKDVKQKKLDKRLEPVFVKPPETPLGIPEREPVSKISNTNLFQGKSFDINTFNIIFENIKLQNKNDKSVEYIEDMETYDFGSGGFSTLQPIVEYAGIIVPDTEPQYNVSDYNTFTYNPDQVSSNAPVKPHETRKKMLVRNEIKNINDHLDSKQKKIRKELEEKRKKVEASLHLYENQSADQMLMAISDYDADTLCNRLTKGAFE